MCVKKYFILHKIEIYGNEDFVKLRSIFFRYMTKMFDDSFFSDNALHCE